MSDSGTPRTVELQALLPMGLSRQEYWSGLPCPSPGDLSKPGIKPASPCSSCIAGKFFTTEPPGNSQLFCYIKKSNGLSCSLNRSFLPLHDFAALCIGHLEYIFSLDYAYFPNVKSFLLYKKSHIC